MHLLLIDTAGSASEVALAEDGRVVDRRSLPGRSASEGLVPAVRELLSGKSLQVKDLTAILVNRGPGSFTGVRVGVSAAKGLSEAAGVPIVAVSRLKLLAQNIENKGVVWAVLGAGRGEFYVGEYRGGTCASEGLYTLEAFERMVSGGQGTVFCETSVELALTDFHSVRVEEPGVEDLLKAGRKRIEEGTFDDAATLDANYLWRMEEEILARLAVQGARE